MIKIKQLKKTHIFIAVGVIIVVILFVLRLILPFIIKGIVERKLSKQMGVRASIGDVSLNLLGSSLFMRNITVENPPDYELRPFLSMQQIFMDVELASLFSNEIRFKLVDVKHFELHIQRLPEGRINLMKILKSAKSGSSPPTEKPAVTKKAGEKQSTKGIFLHCFKAEDVQIIFEDHAVSESPLLTELKDIAISLNSFRFPDTSAGTKSNITINGRLVATKDSLISINSAFQLGDKLPITIISDSQIKFEDIYVPHFNAYFKRYGYIFTSGMTTLTYSGNTNNGAIDGLANIRFKDVHFEKTNMKLSTVLLGIPLQSVPQLFRDPNAVLELSLEVRGDINNLRISWSSLSEQLLLKTLGNTFRTGTTLIRKPFDLIVDTITQPGKEGSLFNKLKEVFNPQIPAEKEKEKIHEDKQKGGL